MSGPWPSSGVAVEVPAHVDFVATIRAVTRSMAVLSDLSIDDVEELQMAVDEAATLLLPLVDPGLGRRLRVSFEVADGKVGIALSTACVPGGSVDRSGLAWMLLSTLDPDVSVEARDGEIAIAVSRSRVDQQA
jgi:serine/threonine-protein kinase RsbW